MKKGPTSSAIKLGFSKHCSGWVLQNNKLGSQRMKMYQKIVDERRAGKKRARSMLGQAVSESGSNSR